MRRALAMAALAAVPILAGAQTLDFKGVQLGSSREEARDALGMGYRSWSCLGWTDVDELCTAEGVTFANNPTNRVQFGFQGHRLVYVEVTMSPAYFALAIAALRQKYGNPAASNSGTVRTVGGASVDQQTALWRVGKLGQVYAQKRVGNVTESLVRYVTAERAAAEAAAARKAKPDI